MTKPDCAYELVLPAGQLNRTNSKIPPLEFAGSKAIVWQNCSVVVIAVEGDHRVSRCWLSSHEKPMLHGSFRGLSKSRFASHSPCAHTRIYTHQSGTETLNGVAALLTTVSGRPPLRCVTISQSPSFVIYM